MATAAEKEDPFTLFGANLGDIGQGLSGIGSIVGGVTDFLNVGNQEDQANRQYDLSLGNFANQAQAVNNQLENQIRTRLGNQGIASNTQGYEAMVAAELAKVNVGTDPTAAQAGPQGSNFLPALPASGQAPVQAQGQPQAVNTTPQQSGQVSAPISLGQQPQAADPTRRGRM